MEKKFTAKQIENELGIHAADFRHILSTITQKLFWYLFIC